MSKWPVKELQSITSKIGSGATPRGGQKAYKVEGIPLIRSLNVHDRSFREAKLAFIDETQASALSNVVVETGDVLLNITGASIARCCIAPDAYLPARVNQHVSILRPSPDHIRPDYLCYFLTGPTAKSSLLETGDQAGATRQALTKSQLESFQIPVPSLAEQERIVAILDEAFDGLATATAHTERKLQNARDLFQSTLQSTFQHKGKNWRETTLGEEVELAAGFAFKSKDYIKDESAGIRLLRGDNIMQGEFRWEAAALWPNDDISTYEKFQLEENDVVLAMDRPWVAAGLKIARVSQADLPCLQVQRTARLRVKENLIWQYLFHLLRGNSFIQYILGGQTGLGVPHISGKQILSFQFSKPPLPEQRAIVEKLDELFAQTRQLEALYQRQLTAYSELKQSLLHQAFSGKL